MDCQLSYSELLILYEDFKKDNVILFFKWSMYSASMEKLEIMCQKYVFCLGVAQGKDLNSDVKDL